MWCLLHAVADKATGQSEAIVITADKGRPSEADIEEMLRVAEMYAQQDKDVAERVGAKNALEQYVYNMQSSVKDSQKLGKHITDADKQTVMTSTAKVLEWLTENPDADKEEIDSQKEDLESIINPIVTSLYEKTGGAPSPPADDDDDDVEHDDL